MLGRKARREVQLGRAFKFGVQQARRERARENAVITLVVFVVGYLLGGATVGIICHFIGFV
jgi:hypothetical protein